MSVFESPFLFVFQRGGRHTNVESLPKGFPRSEYGKIKEAIKELDIEGFFLKRPKPNGIHVSLNPQMLLKVREVLEAE